MTAANNDIDAIRARYAEERARRLRPAGTDQYRYAEGALASLDKDPYAPPPSARAPRVEDLDILVIGAGLGGLQLGAALRRKHIDSFRILDVAADFGGTWYWNRYPGLRCDVESYIYLPFLEETGYMPSERYVRGCEILAYCQRLGRHFSLYERALFQTSVTGMRWDDDAARWWVSTDRGDTFRARFVTTQSGIFSRPQLPGIEGLESFQGKMFHSARWDYDYTGGDTFGGLAHLADKRVGLLGTGTTALQVVPEVAKCARHLTVFQRTPTAVGVRDNGPTDSQWFAALPPGWQRQREITFNQLANGERADCPVDDGWARFFNRLIDAVETLPADQRTPEAIGLAQEQADYAYNDIVRARVDEYVQDAQTAALLKAYYRTLCKRPGFSDDYLPVFNRPNVSLVDVSQGIERVTASGMLINGKQYALDCLIFCTGFALGTSWTHQAGYNVLGRDGRRLSEKWDKGLVTYHGLFSAGFPNLFFMGLTQTGTTINVPHMLREQIEHLTYIVRRCLDEGLTRVEATEAAEQDWQNQIEVVNAMRRPFQEACTPGYFNAEGRTEDQHNTIGSGIYFPSTAFFSMWDAWREKGDFAGLSVS
ncbi:MAG: NAD(P)/FAD-dependent oxidoreductase [Proteobacteria bacterium]|nr:NAD(P)/FAD-dependent oxidoreductase [Pseudomonadota bacterium]